MSARTIGFACVVAAVLFEALGQLAFKRGAEQASSEDNLVVQAARWWRNRAVLLGIGCFIIEAFVWTMALRRLEVSMAFPAGSLSFVFVALLARFFLQEEVGLQRWIGIWLILGGVVLIGIS